MEVSLNLLTGQINGIQIGNPKPMNYAKKEILTSYVKEQVNEPVFATTTNLTGDQQADLKHHGGPDKAICVYPTEHYTYWEKRIGKSFHHGDFGENLSLEGLTEDKVRIGDILQAGDCLFQISQPRQPCYKIAAFHQVKELPVWIQQTGYSGYYLRVLKEGTLAPHSSIKIIDKGSKGITIAYANQIMYGETNDRLAIENILLEEALADSWRKQYIKKLSHNK